MIRMAAVPGDLVDCGTGRGGTSIFMAAYLAGHEIFGRELWVADRFGGGAPPDEDGPAWFPPDLNTRAGGLRALPPARRARFASCRARPARPWRRRRSRRSRCCGSTARTRRRCPRSSRPSTTRCGRAGSWSSTTTARPIVPRQSTHFAPGAASRPRSSASTGAAPIGARPRARQPSIRRHPVPP